MEQIKEKDAAIDFYNYPDVLFLQSADTVWTGIYPFETFSVRIKLHSTIKTVYWERIYFATDPRADKLTELINIIREIVESKPEYQRLSAPNGGYI